MAERYVSHRSQKVGTEAGVFRLDPGDPFPHESANDNLMRVNWISRIHLDGPALELHDEHLATLLDVAGDRVVRLNEAPAPEEKESPTSDSGQPEDVDPIVPEVQAGATDLPADFPGRGEFMEVGITTIEQVAAIEDVTKLRGVGKATARKVADYLTALVSESS